MNYFANKTVGFYISVVATILAIVSLVLYRGTTGALTMVTTLIVAAIVVEVLLIVLSIFLGGNPILNLAPCICAVFFGSVLVYSFNPNLDAIGYVVSGLYTFDQIKPFVIFVAVAAVTFLLYLIASFTRMGKPKAKQ